MAEILRLASLQMLAPVRGMYFQIENRQGQGRSGRKFHKGDFQRMVRGTRIEGH